MGLGWTFEIKNDTRNQSFARVPDFEIRIALDIQLWLISKSVTRVRFRPQSATAADRRQAADLRPVCLVPEWCAALTMRISSEAAR
jgi:hypothetical protein